MSSRIWCVAPSSPNVNLHVKHRFYIFISKLLIDEFGHKPSCRKLANVPVKEFYPIVNPAAIPIMFLLQQFQFGKNALMVFFEIIKF
jgi:hypothetical protein